MHWNARVMRWILKDYEKALQNSVTLVCLINSFFISKCTYEYLIMRGNARLPRISLFIEKNVIFIKLSPGIILPMNGQKRTPVSLIN